MEAKATQHLGTNSTQKVIGYLLKELVENVVTVRVRELIANLLDANALEKFIARKGRCHVSEVIEECLAHHQAAAAKKQIVFLAGISAGLWAGANRSALVQVLDDLISNAINFSPPNTSVQVHALRENDAIVINVRDQGFGVNEAGREKLFQKFSDLMACPGAEKISSGVGVAIVKKLAAALSGSIRWRSSVGAGSTYTIKLPVAGVSRNLPELSEIKLLARSLVELPESMPHFGFRN